ncbi:MAG: S-adenosylmethionine:tRNA ribosyltransferase-isomerase [Cyclobacteriaceae bacterium]|nr:S-adenosylmethionine:tRNA ribosyltransferase-isomerase [Cyclobacteriaceae bacterium]
MPNDFNIEQYNYTLPEDKIAKYPLLQRDLSKLLRWEGGHISHHTFSDAPHLIPEKSLLVFNDTRVIAARLLFAKSTGAQIELFLLHPELPTRDISEAMRLENEAVWLCLVGNKKRWKEGQLMLTVGKHSVKASYHDREANLIKLEWTAGITFAEIVNLAGKTPLPPYLKRKAEAEDTTRYQTVYSKNHGAVAAPTAGLHFTEPVLAQLARRGIASAYLTLHVSAGTFKPVESEDYRNHDMHCEQIVIHQTSLENLLNHQKRIVAVGTTSLRILESLFWYGAMLSQNPQAHFFIDQDLPYHMETNEGFAFSDALHLILARMKAENIRELHGETEIFIYPGYKIRTATGLFTNFHLPKSTLLLLVSAFTDGAWKGIYHEAIANDYRFLSYGDSSLLIR